MTRLKQFLWGTAATVAGMIPSAKAAEAECRPAEASTHFFASAHEGTSSASFLVAASSADKLSGAAADSTSAAPVPASGTAAASRGAEPPSAREGEFAGNIRLDQAWGTAFAARQAPAISAANQPFSPIPQAAFYAFPAATYSFGFAGEGGLSVDTDYLSPGDKLWFQAAYEKSAFGSPVSNAPTAGYSSYSQDRVAGSVFLPESFLMRSSPLNEPGCIFSGSAVCDRHGGFEIAGTYKNSWLPILSLAIYGSYLEVHYQADTLAGLAGGAAISAQTETRSGVSPPRAPLNGFDIGTEFMYTHLGQIRPQPIPADAAVTTNGLSAPQPDINIYEGRLRLKRAF